MVTGFDSFDTHEDILAMPAPMTSKASSPTPQRQSAQGGFLCRVEGSGCGGGLATVIGRGGSP